ncbi:MAG TPA: MoaD/ThiS family protein [Planctomycetota bacterium]|nr:MoaD/ThiS family protein [Planctomycetota bacterium]
MQVRVRLFAGLRERFGAEEILLDDLPGDATVSTVRAILESRCPDLRGLPAAAAVNLAYVPGDRRLEEGDEVALLPPVSGG